MRTDGGRADCRGARRFTGRGRLLSATAAGEADHARRNRGDAEDGSFGEGGGSGVSGSPAGQGARRWISCSRPPRSVPGQLKIPARLSADFLDGADQAGALGEDELMALIRG